MTEASSEEDDHKESTMVILLHICASKSRHNCSNNTYTMCISPCRDSPSRSIEIMTIYTYTNYPALNFSMLLL